MEIILLVGKILMGSFGVALTLNSFINAAAVGMIAGAIISMIAIALPDPIK